MPRITTYLFILIFLVSCSDTELVEIKNEQGLLLESFRQKEDGTVHGPRKIYFESGQLQMVENYSEGYLSGPKITYYENGIIEIEELYKDSKLNGPFKAYYDNAQLNISATYELGQMTGLVTVFNKDGKLKEEVSFKNNEENGPFKEYHPNGQLAWEGNYINGENEIGIILQYDEQGTMVKKMKCDTFMNFSKCQTIWPVSQIAK